MERRITFIAENKKRESKDKKDKPDNGLTPRHQEQEAQPYIPQNNSEK